MPGIRVAVQLASLGLPLKQALPLVARLGAAAVELDARHHFKPQEMSPSAVRDLRRQLDDYNLRVAAVGFNTRRGYDVQADLERRVDATKAAMRFAHALGASVVINQVGRVPSEPKGPAWELLVQVLSDLGHYGQKHGALLAAQTGTESGADLARLLAALPDGALGVDLDPGQLIINGFSADEAVAALGRHVLHVHARDGVRDLARGRGLEVPLGRGTVDFARLVGELEQRDYRGYFTAARENSTSPAEELAAAVSYLKSL